MNTDSKYEILPHTADIRIRITAGNIQDLFSTALKAMNHIIKPSYVKKGVAPPLQDHIDIESSNHSTLLIDFLSRLLTHSHINKAIYEVLSYEKLEQTHLLANVRGYFVDGFDEDVKAVSYTETEILKNFDNRFEAVIVLDI